jgi:hypothetical protein
MINPPYAGAGQWMIALEGFGTLTAQCTGKKTKYPAFLAAWWSCFAIAAAIDLLQKPFATETTEFPERKPGEIPVLFAKHPCGSAAEFVRVCKRSALIFKFHGE